MAGRPGSHRQLVEAWSLAFMFPLSIAIGFGWGYWMDKWFGTWPWLSAIFTGFGVIAAFVNLFRMAASHDETGRGADER